MNAALDRDIDANPKARGRNMPWIIGGVVAFFGLFFWWGLQPLSGGPRVGICRTLLELRIQYPDTIRMTSTEVLRNIQRLYFTDIDAYGDRRSDMFECDFNPDLTIADARLNRVSLPADTIQRFNRTIPGLIINKELNNIIPGDPGDNLLNLKVN